MATRPTSKRKKSLPRRETVFFSSHVHITIINNTINNVVVVVVPAGDKKNNNVSVY